MLLGQLIKWIRVTALCWQAPLGEKLWAPWKPFPAGYLILCWPPACHFLALSDCLGTGLLTSETKDGSHCLCCSLKHWHDLCYSLSDWLLRKSFFFEGHLRLSQREALGQFTSMVIWNSFTASVCAFRSASKSPPFYFILEEKQIPVHWRNSVCRLFSGRPSSTSPCSLPFVWRPSFLCGINSAITNC